MKIFLTKIIKKYPLQSVYASLVFVGFLLYVAARVTSGASWENPIIHFLIIYNPIVLYLAASEVFEPLFSVEVWSVIENVIFFLLVVVIAPFFWSLPVWGIIYIVQRLRKTNTV
jgi:hypothetical protein